MKNLLMIFMLFCSIKSTAQDSWKPNPKYIKGAKQSTSTATKKAFQCYGTTAKGERCKRKVNADHSYCYQHTNQQ